MSSRSSQTTFHTVPSTIDLEASSGRTHLSITRCAHLAQESNSNITATYPYIKVEEVPSLSPNSLPRTQAVSFNKFSSHVQSSTNGSIIGIFGSIPVQH